MRLDSAVNTRSPRRHAAAAAVAALVGFGAGQSVSAQSNEAVIVVDVMVVNDDGGTLDGTTVTFEHTAIGGGTTGGTDNDADTKCLTTDGGTCYIAAIPTGPGELTSAPVDGYTTTITCTSDDGSSTTDGATWDTVTFGEIFCVVMLDDIAPTATTAPTTTAAPTTTTTLPTTTTTVAPTTAAPTTAAPTTAAPVTAPATTTAPVMELPETGGGDSTTLAWTAIALLALGAGSMRIARR